MGKNSANPPKGNILVVDDTPDNLRVLSSLLTTEGYWVRKALNGQMALTACQTLVPDLILLDINMPDLDGYYVCAALKSAEKTGEIPVIFISGLDSAWDKVKAFQVGGADYITKPFQLEEVLVRVENQLNLKRLQNELQEKNRLLHKQNEQMRREIAKRKQAEAALQKANKKLQHLACFDSLTEVSNRRQFDKYLHQKWHRLTREQSPLSLILCDIDYFKSYNDTYGHPAGDECLKQIASAIRHALRNPADLVARYGGEEFAAILPNATFPEAVEVAQQIQQEVQRLNILHAGSQISDSVTLSLGIACMLPSEEASPEVLIANADRALYQAKHRGRNCYCTCEGRSPALPTAVSCHNPDIYPPEPEPTTPADPKCDRSHLR